MKQRITTFFAGGLLTLALFGIATAGPIEDGYAAYQRGDYATAMRLWRPLADQGNVFAQDFLGAMFSHVVPQGRRGGERQGADHPRPHVRQSLADSGAKSPRNTKPATKGGSRSRQTGEYLGLGSPDILRNFSRTQAPWHPAAFIAMLGGCVIAA
jgi:hypothetical protein